MTQQIHSESKLMIISISKESNLKITYCYTSLIPRAHHLVYSTMKKRDARGLRWKAINRDSSDPRNFSIVCAHLTKSALTDLSIRYVKTLCLSHEWNWNRSKSDKSSSRIMVDREFPDRSILIFATALLKGIAKGGEEWIEEQVVQKVGYWKHLLFLFTSQKYSLCSDIRI